MQVDNIKTIAWFAAALKDHGSKNSTQLAKSINALASVRELQRYKIGATVPKINIGLTQVSDKCSEIVLQTWNNGILSVPLWSSFALNDDVVIWLEKELTVDFNSLCDNYDGYGSYSDYIFKLMGYTKALIEQPSFSLDQKKQPDPNYSDRMKIACLSLSIFYMMMPISFYDFDENMTLKEIKLTKKRRLEEALAIADSVTNEYNLSAQTILDCVVDEMKNMSGIK